MKYIIVSFISQLSAGEWFPVVSIRFPIVSNSVTVYFQSDSEITLFATIPLQQKSTMHYSVLFDSFSYIYIHIFIYPIFCSNSQYQNLRVSEYEINFRYGIQWIASAFTYNAHGKIPTFSHLNVDFAAELFQATAKVREVEPEEVRSGAEGI